MSIPASRARLAAVACGLALAACRVSDTPVADAELLAAFGPALEIGRATREDALLRLGAPVERFEGDRILCWRIAPGAAGPQPVSMFVSPWYGSAQATDLRLAEVDPRVRIEPMTVRSLVLVFDEAGVLRTARALCQP